MTRDKPFKSSYHGLHLLLLTNRRIVMFDCEKNVNIFVYILITKPSLFLEEDRNELIKLIDKQPDIQSISKAISGWCLEHPEVSKALVEFKEVEMRGPGEKRVNTNIPKYELDNKNIINAIQQSSSSAKDVKKPTSNN